MVQSSTSEQNGIMSSTNSNDKGRSKSESEKSKSNQVLAVDLLLQRLTDIRISSDAYSGSGLDQIETSNRLFLHSFITLVGG